MPVHDWSLVSAGTFHAFHVAWVAEIQRALNGGLLPEAYYALAEQVAGQTVPDVLTLQSFQAPADDSRRVDPLAATGSGNGSGEVALAEAPPRVAVVEELSESAVLRFKRRRIVIRHATGDRIVALLEIVSPGNKEGVGPMEDFVEKAVAALQQQYHLLIIDLFRPGTSNPRGIHDLIWRALGGREFAPPADKPLTLAAYRVGIPLTAYVEPLNVGAAIPPMPLFYEPDHYVSVPLEETYAAAYEGVPRRWKRVIESAR